MLGPGVKFNIGVSLAGTEIHTPARKFAGVLDLANVMLGVRVGSDISYIKPSVSLVTKRSCCRTLATFEACG